MNLTQADACTQLRCLVGSKVHGLNLEGTDDRDEMGVLLEPMEYAVGIQNFEQIIYRTAAEREGKADAKSIPGDLDLTLYSLRKYCRLALNGNPSIINLLYIPTEYCSIRTPHGARLQELAPAFLSKRVGTAFLGYLTAQKQRLTGERGSKNVRRPDLEAKYGYDTKYAMHALRLGLQGIELLTTGTLAFPTPQAAYIREVREGKVDFNSALTRIGEAERQLKDILDVCDLPPEGDVKKVTEFLVTTYGAWWSPEFNKAYETLRDRSNQG